MAAAGKGRVCVAQIGAPHGVRGELRVKPFTSDPASVGQYGPLESEDGKRQFEILALRSAKDMLVVRLKGVENRDAAAALRNLRLFVPRERLDPPEEGEFYHADLIGLMALSVAGQTMGKITAVLNFGAGDLIEIAPLSGGQTFLIPFSKAGVPVVDLSRGIVVVDPPEGTFDVEVPEAENKAQGG